MNKINIVIPMAGAGSRFVQKGFNIPKPFIEIKGKTMIERVLEGLKLKNCFYILIIQEQFLQYHKKQLDELKSKFADISFVNVKKLTQGASCTALASHQIINNNTPTVICDSDNIFNPTTFNKFIDDALYRNLDGSLLSFESREKCFSFAEIGFDNFVTKTKEKQAISTHALAGAYYFKRGSDFVKHSIDMMIYNDRDENEFYMSNVYNYLIKSNGKVGIYTIKNTDWHCVGTPEQLDDFLKLSNGKRR